GVADPVTEPSYGDQSDEGREGEERDDRSRDVAIAGVLRRRPEGARADDDAEPLDDQVSRRKQSRPDEQLENGAASAREAAGRLGLRFGFGLLAGRGRRRSVHVHPSFLGNVTWMVLRSFS